MKKKISEQQKAIIKARIEWREQMITILKGFRKRCQYSESTINCETNDPMFNDSCKFVELHSLIAGLEETLTNLNMYSNTLLDNLYE